ncbi:tripartite motif-containing protein 16-like protein [Megalops cyprinoides]|uniref:tripartite motif-containing protein 16-like protein n=1 Tax=Megalops cyprinoides TaxID=118141 RepID=UPI0018645212|nr:tripartite motif-containing protein 16-like protein [Megalops cyprinoides]
MQEQLRGPEELRPEDVACDACLQSAPRRALKSCLTCLVSYCQAHLRPHLENAKFQNHRLVDPLQDIERRSCEAHGRPLERYCPAHSCCMCQQCEEEEHQGHGATPLREARGKIEEELQQKQEEITKTVTAAENAISKLQINTVSIKSSVQEVHGLLEQRFSELQAAVERAQREAVELLEGQERRAVRQAEGVQAHLQQRCAEMKSRLLSAEKLRRNKNDIDFLQEHAQWRKETLDVSLPNVNIGLTDSLTAFGHVVTEATQELCEQLLNAYRDKLKAALRSEKLGVKTVVCDPDRQIPVPDPKTREDFLKYSATLTFDAQTAHSFLRLTEENRKATNTTPWQHAYPDVPERFEHWRQVLAAESFYLGRHYFEAEASGEGTHVGLTYRSIDRKSQEDSGCITGNGFSWCLQWNGRGFSAWHGGVETPLPEAAFTRIGVYVDFDGGLLAFYGVGDSMTPLHQYRVEFLEPLYPAFWLSKKENVVLLVKHQDVLPQTGPLPPCTLPSSPRDTQPLQQRQQPL